MQELIAQQGARAVELNHADDMAFEFPVRYALHRVEADGSILMLGRDLRPIAEMQQQLVKAQLALERDYEAQREIDTRYRVLMETTRDAIVVVSMTTGRIVDLNMAAGVMLGGSRHRPDRGGHRAGIRRAAAGRVSGKPGQSWPWPMPRPAGVAGAAVAQAADGGADGVPRRGRAAADLSAGTGRQRPTRCATSWPKTCCGLFHEGADGVVFTDRDGHHPHRERGVPEPDRCVDTGRR